MIARFTTTNRLLSAAMLVLALTGAVGMFWIGRNLASLGDHLHPQPQEEQRRLRAQIRADEQSETALRELMVEIDADRAVVYLAHNGKTDLSGIVPFLFMSTVHIHLRPGLAWQERWSRPTPLSIFTPMLRRMIEEGDTGEPSACLKYDVDSPRITGAGKARMVDRGIELAFVCPLRAGPGPNPVVGLLAVDYLHREQDRPVDAVVQDRMREAAARIHAAMVGAAQ